LFLSFFSTKGVEKMKAACGPFEIVRPPVKSESKIEQLKGVVLAAINEVNASLKGVCLCQFVSVFAFVRPPVKSDSKIEHLKRVWAAINEVNASLNGVNVCVCLCLFVSCVYCVPKIKYLPNKTEGQRKLETADAKKCVELTAAVKELKLSFDKLA
jgi:hypothetical protein